MGEPATTLPKGQRTLERVLHEALRMTARVGFGGLSFGTLAQAAGLSKSGLFAHFRSMEDLQVQTLAMAEREWIAAAVRPALAEKRGIARIERLFERYLATIGAVDLPCGSVLIGAVYEFDDAPPGALRDAVVKGHVQLQGLIERLVQQAIGVGDLDPDLDPAQFAFEFRGIVHAHHHELKLMRADPQARRARAAFARLLASCRAP